VSSHLCVCARCVAGSVSAAQIATLFQNLGQPLPYDRLTKIMSDYAVAEQGLHRRCAHMRIIVYLPSITFRFQRPALRTRHCSTSHPNDSNIIYEAYSI
jgi:hypothetical protein